MAVTKKDDGATLFYIQPQQHRKKALLAILVKGERSRVGPLEMSKRTYKVNLTLLPVADDEEIMTHKDEIFHTMADLKGKNTPRFLFPPCLTGSNEVVLCSLFSLSDVPPAALFDRGFNSGTYAMYTWIMLKQEALVKKPPRLMGLALGSDDLVVLEFPSGLKAEHRGALPYRST
ncbi:hypothetical protein GALMADRAFT_205496 [Galerina marginata CBS 339.88]|uniref:Uncharacterized protein n=1 Tax=Galerina marginata (strain CBS 339.88) TaxID=685588 RepID=A0A067TK03_GALM3|nr:hypothetical protein GALMADRAFT_205496 [Galerina marginata CBS 339.88]